MDLFAPNHIVLILLVVLLLFGGKKIPELMKGLGKGMREFKNAKDNVSQSLNNDTGVIKESEVVEIKPL
jgi:sec-independent protein translocase protein TatA